VSIRVNKCIGWGTDDFIPPPDFNEKLEMLGKLQTQEFCTWLMQNKTKIQKLYKKSGHWTVEYFRVICTTKFAKTHIQYLCHDEEYGIEGVILFPPIVLDGCTRTDNTIDYLEETEVYSQKNRFVKLNPKIGIYPISPGALPEWVIGICLFLGIESVIPRLTEALYTYWS